jgi:hypothetical protein
MSLKDDLLPLIDELRAIPGDLGFRPYEVWVRVSTYAGPRGTGMGAQNVSETRLLVGGQNPKVREVKRSDVVAGTAELIEAEFDIGPLTPEFAGGGTQESVINPPKSSVPTEVFFLLKGPGMPSEGLLCKKVGDHFDRPLRIVIRVKGMGRKRPT